MHTHPPNLEALAMECVSTAMQTLPTPLERITCALLQSGVMVSKPNFLSDDDAAERLVDFAKRVHARLRAAQGH